MEHFWGLIGRGIGKNSYCHVRSAASISGFGYGVHQLATDAKVTELNVAIPVQENVGWLYVWEKGKDLQREGEGALSQKVCQLSVSHTLSRLELPFFSFTRHSFWMVCTNKAQVSLLTVEVPFSLHIQMKSKWKSQTHFSLEHISYLCELFSSFLLSG